MDRTVPHSLRVSSAAVCGEESYVKLLSPGKAVQMLLIDALARMSDEPL